MEKGKGIERSGIQGKKKESVYEDREELSLLPGRTNFLSPAYRALLTDVQGKFHTLSTE